MIACTRCGHWHTDAESILEKSLSCTEVKHFWSKVKREHMDRTGHLAQIATNEDGDVICFKCKEKLFSIPPGEDSK